MADSDFTKLSRAGMRAFEEVRLTRLAIFDGDTQEARKDIAQAEAAIVRARKDDTVFMRAEADLTAPAGAQDHQAGDAAAAGSTPAESASAEAISWVPVDGSLSLADDFTTTAGTQSDSLADANHKLAQGDAAQAMHAIKLVDVNATFVAVVAPLDKTTAGIEQAAQLIDDGHYFQASQVLKHVQDDVRSYAVDITSIPTQTAHKTSSDAANSGSSSSGTSDQTKTGSSDQQSSGQ